MTIMTSDQEISKKYQKLEDIDHVLLRPGMYIGSTNSHPTEVFLPDGYNFKLTRITYNPGFIKLFDEVVTNSVDEHTRNPKLNLIKVTVDEENDVIIIEDNGGIPVIKHTEHKEWIPELLFSNLKAGSNFDDNEDRTSAGLHGMGVTLTNIFSSTFEIETADGTNLYTQIFSENMRKRTVPKIVPSTKRYTKVTYRPDFDRFKMTGIPSSASKMIKKRLLDIAACNRKLKIEFNGEKFAFPSFKDYALRYVDNVFYEDSKHWKIGVGLSEAGFKSVSFVNSVETKDGGEHVDYIINQITSILRETIKKKYKMDIVPSELRRHMILFINSTIINPSFNSQTKEKLVTEKVDFGTSHTVSPILVNAIFNSDIMKTILDWIDKKKLAEERAKLRKLNRNLGTGKVLKLIDAKYRGQRDRCTLSIFEGDSASSAFRDFRDPQLQGAFPLKGKFRNVRELTNLKVIQNDEVKGLMSSIGLKLGEEPKNLRYGKILIYTDADPDGNGIAAALINFFGKYWPELFDQGKIFKVMTPIVVVKKKNETKYFYTDKEYQIWEKKTNDIKKWEIEYKKGLAALLDDEYEEIIKNPVAVQLIRDDEAEESLIRWFGHGSDGRKEKILGMDFEKYKKEKGITV